MTVTSSRFRASWRRDMTESEQLLWSRLRRKQILGVQFYRQKPIGNYIVDFYAPRIKVVVELDGSQHFEVNAIQEDTDRDEFMNRHGLIVLRFDNLQVLQRIDAVLEEIFNAVGSRID